MLYSILTMIYRIANNRAGNMLVMLSFSGGGTRSLRQQAYMDSKKRPWIHLVDGGISDNLGLRADYTLFNLENDEIDRLIAAGHQVLRDSAECRQFVTRNNKEAQAPQ